MLNHSVSQLRQLKVVNLTPVAQRAARSASNAASTFSPSRSVASSRPDEHELDHERPPAVRRRSTRGNPSVEPAISRHQRLETAIGDNTFESFVVLYEARETIYISEIQNGRFPTYLPLEIDGRRRTLEMAIYVRCPSQRWKLLLRTNVLLGDLVPCLNSDDTKLKNAVMLQFEDELWYTLPTVKEQEQHHMAPRAESYSFNQVMRLQTSTEVINDALHSLESLKLEISARLNEADDRIQRLCQLDITRTGIAELKADVKALRRKNAADRLRIEKLRDSDTLRKSLLNSSQSHMQSVKSDLAEARDRLSGRQPSLGLLSSEIRRLQRELTTALSLIYPITNGANVSRIRGARTARNSDYWMEDHEQAAALGYMAHFVFLLSLYLFIPLRYPVRPISSHSSIIDPISIMPANSDVKGGPPFSIKRDPRYPLYFERGGVERLQWGVFLLNKNIEQLLQGRGLVCGDLRDSLQNLGGLVVWLVSVNEDEDVSLSRSSNTAVAAPDNHTSPGTNGYRADAQGQTTNGSHEESSLDDGMAHLEITDHEGLLAAQLRSRMKGKRRMTQVSEKEEDAVTDP